MPDLATVNGFGPQQFSAAFGAVYEHSQWIAERAFARRPFASQTDLYLALFGVVQAASEDEKVALLNAHPELAGQEAQSGTLTSASTHEQKGAGLNALSHAEFVELAELNRQYKARFGFPYIISARLNSKAAIFGMLKARLTNTREQELQNSIAQVGEIARLRVNDILNDPRN